MCLVDLLQECKNLRPCTLAKSLGRIAQKLREVQQCSLHGFLSHAGTTLSLQLVGSLGEIRLRDIANAQCHNRVSDAIEDGVDGDARNLDTLQQFAIVDIRKVDVGKVEGCEVDICNIEVDIVDAIDESIGRRCRRVG